MPNPITLSLIALVISVSSFALSAYLAWRDRPRVSAKSAAQTNEMTGEYSSIFVTVTNSGRRTVILRHLWGLYEDKSQGCQQLSEDGVRLNEGEFHELEFGKFDGIMVNGDEMSGLIDLFFEDTSGKRYKIAGVRKNIALVRNSNHEFGVKTHSY